MNVKIDFEALPEDIHAFTVKREGGYHVVLNDRSTRDRQLSALLHEVCHIFRGDLESSGPVGQIERECVQDLQRALTENEHSYKML